ncbi:hypothetical protein ASE31_22005 [Acidovorax sp. Root217]|nr:hypothetical protein ASE31_22005 [Acidovorax sp. Root217]
MRMNDRDLRLRFPHAKVHVVAENRRADETILMGAEIDSKIFVLSNDRFADFPEKKAVFGKRIIRHEIVYSTIYIHDMNIAIPLSNSHQM